jgi:hypothetical protein
VDEVERLAVIVVMVSEEHHHFTRPRGRDQMLQDGLSLASAGLGRAWIDDDGLLVTLYHNLQPHTKM